jgi:glycine/D-amino acid oxidase-like deaminating enzyme
VRVVIVGLGKSGTTALVYAVRAAMPADTQMLFEPRSHVALQSGNVAAKVLIHPRFPIDHAFYRQFDRIVLLVRDPRDLLISKALYRIFNARTLHADAAKLDQYLGLLRAKEKDPRSVSLMRINAMFESLVGPTLHSDEGRARSLNDAFAFHEAFPDSMVFKYEAMVEGQFDALARYLSLPAEAMKPDVPAHFGRVVRSRRAGNWRHWFCPEDVEHYRPLLSAYMSRYDYGDDWTLATEPVVRPEECSGYVMRLVRERREGFPAAVRFLA